MRKNNSAMFGWMLILSPFVFIYDKLGPLLFWGAVGFISVMMFAMSSSSNKQKRQKRQGRTNAKSGKFQPVMQRVNNEDGDDTIEINWPETFIVIDKAIHKKDYDFARTWLQKFAQVIVRKEVPQAMRDRFRILMTVFAKEDPLYLDVLPKIKFLVDAEPGILQTAIYPMLPQYSQETLRYVLYFAHELGDLTRLKKGRSYQLFGPVQTTTIAPGERIGQTIANTTITINRNPVDERIAALHREATTHKGVNWDAAVACLQEAAGLMRLHNSLFDTDRWTRLPVFLQQAGRFDEAMQEFDSLLSDVKPRAIREMTNSRSPSAVKRHTHLNYYRIYDKMRMVCKRQKLHDKAQEYQNLSERHKLVHDELIKVAEIERQNGIS